MEYYLERFQNLVILGNSGRDYVIAIAIMVASFIALKIIKVIVAKYLKKLAEKTETKIDNILILALSKIKTFSYIIVSIYLGLNFLSVINWLDQGVRILFYAVLVYEAIGLMKSIINHFTYKALKKDGEEGQARETTHTLSVIFQVLLWSLGLVLILSNMGVNVTSLIAGLGIGGIAIALALQNILADVFSSFSILIDKPFKVGDFIVSGDDMGIVQKIGIKTSRLKTLDGQMLIISNQELTNARVQNFHDIQKRRALFTLGVIYETDIAKLEEIPKIIKDITEKTDKADLDRCHFKSYGDYSLNYEISIYIHQPGYNDYLDVLQAINLDIFRRFKEKGIEFAYPTQVELQKTM